MRHERSCIRTAVERLKNRRFHFEETVCGIPVPDSLEHIRPLDECFSYIGIGDKIKISLAVALFLIRKAVPLFRKRAERLGKHGEVQDTDGGFSRVCSEYSAFHPEDISHVYQFEEIPFIFTDSIFPEIKLDIPFFITKRAECRFSVPADNHNTACHFDMLPACFQSCRIRMDIFTVMGAFILSAVRLKSQCGNLLQLPPSDQHLVVQFFFHSETSLCI